MTTNQVRMAVLVGAAGALLASVTGCRVEDHKDGDATNVKIATPFGGMSVKTNDKVIQNNMDLDVYPGAVLERKKNENDSAADINMSFGSFHLGVKAVSYTTPDSTDKVMAFYQKDLAKHGAVIKCKDDRPVGTPTHTQDGLTCDDDNNKKNSIQLDEKDAKGSVELKFGSKQHQHIVSIEPHDGGTKIGLVALDLPGSFSVTEEDNKQ